MAENIPGRSGVLELRRNKWVRTLRWLGLGVLLALYAGVLATFYQSHVVMGRGMSPKEPLLFVLLTLVSVALVPQIILEADYVRAEDDFIIVKNLLFTFKESWKELQSFRNPPWLKFAILKGSKFVYLLNKRDLPEFDALAERINEKGTKLLH